MTQPSPKHALDVAKYLINNSYEILTPLHVNKLVFFSHGWNLGMFGHSLISDTVEAWEYGPVIPSIYKEFKKYNKRKIERNEYIKNNRKYADIFAMFSETDKQIMNQVIDTYSKRSGAELIAITHRDGSPWDQCYIPDVRGIEIPNHLIEEYYKQKAKQANDK